MKRLTPASLLILLAHFFTLSVLGQPVTGTYSARGVVEAIAPNRSQATIHHQAIPGYMMEMTMDFPVKSTNELAGVSPGDQITFTLVVRTNEDWIENIQRIGRQALTAAKAASSSDTEIHELKPGDLMPDNELIAENNQRIRFSDFRGRALAFTFFFTRCPLPDFCPRMNRNFSEARNLILSAPGAPTNWEILSISFDPAFDTPKTLADYAGFYRGENTNHWLFAAAPISTLNDLEPRLDLMVMRNGGSISHNLRTVVLDPRGRIFRQFDGNQWTPAQLADAIMQAARIPRYR
jgi:protein SCO1/2